MPNLDLSGKTNVFIRLLALYNHAFVHFYNSVGLYLYVPIFR